MATYTVGAVFRQTIHGQLVQGQNVSLVYEYILQTSAAPLTFAQVVDDMVEVADATITEVALISSEHITWTGASVSTLDADEVSGFVPFDAPIVGQVAEGLVPNPCAVVFNYATGIAKHQLRKFIPGAGVSDIGVGGAVEAAAALAWAAVAGDVLTSYEATNGLWRYCYYSKHGTPEQFLLFPNAVSVKTQWGIQGRRRD